jgi:hypothetical protein
MKANRLIVPTTPAIRNEFDLNSIFRNVTCERPGERRCRQKTSLSAVGIFRVAGMSRHVPSLRAPPPPSLGGNISLSEVTEGGPLQIFPVKELSPQIFVRQGVTGVFVGDLTL